MKMIIATITLAMSPWVMLIASYGNVLAHGWQEIAYM